MKRFQHLWCLCLCVMAAGCIETKDEFVLNPDGSGKVRHEAVLQAMNLNISESTPSDPEKLTRQMVGKELSDAVGVDAWKDVKYERASDGKVRFQGTAYFPDVSKVKFHNGGFKQSLLEPSWTKNAQGQLVLELAAQKKSDTFGDKQKPPTMSDAEVTKKIAEARAQMQEMKPMLVLFAATKVEMAFRLPGVVLTSNNFQKGADGSLQVAFRGEKFTSAMDKLIADDAWMRKAVLEGRNFKKGDPQVDEMMNESLYGQKGPVQAVIGPGAKPQFDYAAEVAAAKKAYPQMVAQLKLPGSVVESAAPVPAGAGLKSIKVGGVRIVWFSDNDNDVRPFNYDDGFTMVLVGDFGGAVQEVSGGQLTAAIASTGEDLLPKKEWDRKLRFPKLSKDKTKVIFDVNFKAPGASVTGLKQLSGELEYLLGGTPKMVDLGLTGLTTGSSGKQYDATIKSVKTNQWKQGTESLELRLELPKHAIKSVTFYDAAGMKLAAEKGSTSWSGDTTTLEYSVTGKWPAKGRVMLEIFDGMKKYKVPFVLKDISLTGQPYR